MPYDSAVAQLYELGHELARTPAHKFDLAHMRVLLQPLGMPERQFRSVLIAGTNGKGSTAATLASILRAAGHRTGLYTSPHLVRINERIRINGEPISDSDFTRAHDDVEAAVARLLDSGKLPWHPSFFEILTAMAFLHFARSGVDIAVLEVGMGGRLDATNVVDPLVSVITDISLDHQKFLGNTVREIAGEKAGIIRPGGTVVTLPQHPEANDVIGNTILDRGARGVSAVPYVPPLSPGSPIENCHSERSEESVVSSDQKRETRTSYPLTVMGQEITVASPLFGRHQLRNLALAVAAAVELNDAGLRITPQDIERGIRETRWPGRFQIEPQGSIDFVLDVAHNPAGAWALRSALSQRYPDRPLLFVFGAMRDKAIAEMAEILFPLAHRVIATRAENPRSAAPQEIRDAAARTGAEIETGATVAAAIQAARRLTPANAVVVITGSIYVVGEAMPVLGIAP
ncbi:MAG: bifunctional folylpolyglutamate synthase/dihydrofolate synthase [Acidobacteriia bacterium]|nr:bifunctional folylpolyglutamate synthase/dihydrofolate synthase [Terriglobia bacterium]